MQLDLIAVLIIFIVSVFIFYKFKLYNSEKHKSAIQLLIGLNVIFTVYVLYKSIQVHSEDVANSDSVFFDTLMTGLIESSSRIFIKYPKMKYYYDEIYNGIYDTHADRDEYLEQLVTYHILNKCSQFTEYYYGHVDMPSYSDKIKIYNVKVLKLINQHFKSDAFKKYTIMYLNDLAGPIPMQWFKEFYNIVPSDMKNTHIAQEQNKIHHISFF